MNWEAIGAVAESISAVIVLVTVIYLAVQVRQLRTQTQFNSHQHYSETSNTMSMGILNTPEAADLIVKALDSYEDLSRSEHLRYYHYLQIQASQLESIFIGQRLIEPGEPVEDYVSGMLQPLVDLPGFSDYWRRSRISYSRDFRDFVDSHIT